jgi:IS5 family transposase
VEKQPRYYPAFMFFPGFTPDKISPDHSALTRLRTHIGARRLELPCSELVEEVELTHGVSQQYYELTVSLDSTICGYLY